MQLEQKYELLEAVTEISDDRDQTIPAWERSTGKQVFVHLLAGGYSAENNIVLTAVGRLSPEHRQHVLGAGDHIGNAYVITDALPWGMSLRKWIESIYAKPPAQPPAVQAPNTPVGNASKPDASDAAKLTRAGTWRIPAFNPGAKSTPVEPVPPAHTPVPAATEETTGHAGPSVADRGTPRGPRTPGGPGKGTGRVHSFDAGGGHGATGSSSNARAGPQRIGRKGR
jgi:hypothetical protein